VFRVTLARAPASGGGWRRRAARDDLIAAPDLLRTVRELGFTGIELGPPGYLPLDELGDLALVGGFAPLRFADEAGYQEDLGLWLDPIVEAIVATGRRGPVVLADGHRTELTAAAYTRINQAVERCRAAGADVVFHHHFATSVETPAEIEALLSRTDVGICFDSGHALVGGGDPVEVAQLCGDRIEHLHLKDVDGTVLARVASGELSVEDAWAGGLFCPFGAGIVDLAAVHAEFADFDGWVVLEQDRVAVAPSDLEAVRAVEARNLAAVRAL
jgi:inosose dehydratase